MKFTQLSFRASAKNLRYCEGMLDPSAEFILKYKSRSFRMTIAEQFCRGGDTNPLPELLNNRYAVARCFTPTALSPNANGHSGATGLTSTDAP